MDVPIAIGLSLAFGMSLYETVTHGAEAYFDASVSLLFFLLIGRTLDHAMREKARSAVGNLRNLSPRGAMVIEPDGARDYRPLAELAAGTRMIVAAGERIPVDGVVVEGASELDCALVTGESAPRPAKVGGPVQAGTLNLSQPLVIEATASAENSFLAETARLMEIAEEGRARYRVVADRAAALYAPLVHSAALLTFLGWLWISGDWHRALETAIAVLIITCPCALGLAVPMVQIMAARRLFEFGVLMKDGSALERLAEIDTVVFDKTGTVTTGQPRLVDPGAADARALALGGALAAHSRHPRSRAVVRAAADRCVGAMSVSSVRETAGCGLEGIGADGAVYRLGRSSWALPDGAETDAGAPLTLSRNGQALAAFRFDDALRSGARDAMARLSGSGLAIELLSGDQPDAVRSAADAVGVTAWRAAQLPADKVGRLADLARAGHKTPDGRRWPQRRAGTCSRPRLDGAGDGRRRRPQRRRLRVPARQPPRRSAGIRHGDARAHPRPAEPGARGRLQCGRGADCRHRTRDAAAGGRRHVPVLAGCGRQCLASRPGSASLGRKPRLARPRASAATSRSQAGMNNLFLLIPIALLAGRGGACRLSLGSRQRPV